MAGKGLGQVESGLDLDYPKTHPHRYHLHTCSAFLFLPSGASRSPREPGVLGLWQGCDRAGKVVRLC